MSTFSEGGRGTLTIRQAQPEDEGAYTCEAINNKGSIFAQPDTIVTVKGKIVSLNVYWGFWYFKQRLINISWG